MRDALRIGCRNFSPSISHFSIAPPGAGLHNLSPLRGAAQATGDTPPAKTGTTRRCEMYNAVRSDDEIDALELAARHGQGSKFGGMSYEDGIEATLTWLFMDDEAPSPMGD